MRIYSTFLKTFCGFLTVFLCLLDGEAKVVRKVCSASAADVAAIKNCQAQMDNECLTIPSEKKRSCFEEPQENKDLSFIRNCSSGAKQAALGFVKTVKDFGANVKAATLDNKAYMRKVRSEAQTACNNDFEYRQAKRKYELMFQNRGPDAAQAESMKMNQAWEACIQNNIGKGKMLGLSLDFPNVDEVKNTLACFNNDSRVEMGCQVVAPMVVGGATGLAIKSALTKSGSLATFKAGRQVSEAMNEYRQSFKERFSLAASKSLDHQADLVSALKNPKVVENLSAVNMDLEGFTRGVIGSDAGKIPEAQNILTTKSPESDRLLNVLKGQDSSRAGRAFQELLAESGFKNPRLFNSQLTNDQLREIFQNKAVRGYMHETPGLSKPIDDLNSGRITVAEFKSQVAANLFHNGPQKGFWDLYTTRFVPGALKDNPAHHNLFKETVLDSGQRTAEGVVIPSYPRSVSKEGIFHTTLDRLSQGTGGGSIKIGYELMGDELSNLINSGQSVKIGAIPKSFEPNGLNTFRELLLGNKDKGISSNPTNTLAQLDDLTQHIQTAKFLNPREADVLGEINRASRDRVLAFKDFVEKNVRVETDAAGNVEKMILSDEYGKVFATLTKDTDARAAYENLEKLRKIEEKFNGDPFTDLMRPRFLSKSEIAKYGLGGAGGAFFYCNQVVEEPQKERVTNPYESGVM